MINHRFLYRFVFVPIVEYSHWSLAVICNLDCLYDYWQRYVREDEVVLEVEDEVEEEVEDNEVVLEVEDKVEDNEVVEDDDENEQKKANMDQTGEGSQYDSEDSERCGIRLSNKGKKKNKASLNKRQVVEAREEKVDEIIAIDEEEEDVDIIIEDSEEQVVVEEQEEMERVPCIVFMDSLKMHSAKTVALMIRSYLKQEWSIKKMNDASKKNDDEKLFHDFVLEYFSEGNVDMKIPLVQPKVPRQPNGFDCGVYALQYCEEIIARWPKISLDNVSNQIVEGFSSAMFSSTHIEVTNLYIKK